jgi:hypothetical protein
MAFASGDDGYVEIPARRDALAVLRRAADQCWERNMCNDEVRAALDHLKRGVYRDAVFDRFWNALAYPGPADRRRLAIAEYRAIVRAVPTFEAQSRKNDF